MNLYSPEAVYRLDRAAVEIDNFNEIELMRLAGERVWHHLLERWPHTTRITVFAGSGNNGGDAFVVALGARKCGIDVQLLVQGDLDKQSASSRHFRDHWEQGGGIWDLWQGQELQGEVIVDGLLGIGLQRELDSDWQRLIDTINRNPSPRVAIDIPSGLSGATGVAQPRAVRADLTVTFIGHKLGQFLADGPDFCGELIFEDLGLSSQARRSIEVTLPVIENCNLPARRRQNSHKNCYGHVLVIGGDQGMSGAIGLAALAALRTGAGLVTALVHPDCARSLSLPAEVMVLDWYALDEKLDQASIVVVGPGLGNSEAAHDCLSKLQTCQLPMVVDASALQADFLKLLESSQVVLTPHPGEAGNLLDSSADKVQADRLQACQQLLKAYDVTCVLKGSGTLIADRKQTEICVKGNPGMASAGMGDVLAGMIGALIGQGLTSYQASRSAVLLHALAADEYTQHADQTGLIAGDVIDAIPGIMQQQRDAD